MCVTTTCGDGVVEGTEQCDDSNRDPFDGCDSNCKVEPRCSNGACTSFCGDGLKFPGEDCDDGNRRDGDGCSSTCQRETGSGFTCSNAAIAPPATCDAATLCPSGYVCQTGQCAKSLTISYRDFVAYNLVSGTSTTGTANPSTHRHPNFENNTLIANAGQIQVGLVQNALDSAGKPQWAANTGTACWTVSGSGATSPAACNGPVLTGATDFARWYRDDAPGDAGTTTYSRRWNSSLVLTKNVVDGGATTYSYNNSSFFPLDTAPSANVWPATEDALVSGHNFHFTSEVHIPFTFRGGETLTFHGDDDVWVFVNGRLALDLGGIKNASDSSITLAAATDGGTNQFGLAVGGFYEFAIFQAERHVTGSNYRLTVTDFDRIVTTCRSTCGDGIKTPDEACDDGAANNTGAYNHCKADCTGRGAFCGDGIVQADKGEECDSTANCSPDCRLSQNAPK